MIPDSRLRGESGRCIGVWKKVERSGENAARMTSCLQEICLASCYTVTSRYFGPVSTYFGVDKRVLCFDEWTADELGYSFE